MKEIDRSKVSQQHDQNLKSAPFAPNSRPELLTTWTSLRGIACLTVLIDHIETHISVTWGYAGGMAVSFFFVLSGYLLTMKALEYIWPLKGRHIPQMPNKEYFLRYFTRRIFRIYPTYIVGLIVHDITYRLGMYRKNWRPTNYLWLVGKTPYFHFWSVRVEAVYYILIVPIVTVVFAYLVRLDYQRWQRQNSMEINSSMSQTNLSTQEAIQASKDRLNSHEQEHQKTEKVFNKPGPMTILGLCAFILITVILHIKCTNLGAPDIIPAMPKFGYGTIGAFFTHFVRLRSKNIKAKKNSSEDSADLHKKRSSSLISTAADISICLILIHTYLSNAHISSIYFGYPIKHRPWYFWTSTNAVMFTLLLFILERIGTKSLFAKFLQSPFLNFIGEKSYSIYIFHKWIFIVATNEIHLPPFDRNAVAFLLALVGGCLCSIYIETSGVRLGEYLTAKGVAWLRKNKHMAKKRPSMDNILDNVNANGIKVDQEGSYLENGEANGKKVDLKTNFSNSQKYEQL